MGSGITAVITYISMEFGEGVDHIKPMHIYYSGVDDQLGAVGTVKAQYVDDNSCTYIYRNQGSLASG